MKKDTLREEAKELRTNGLSYREIGAILNIAKSTARLWTRDIVLKPEHQKRLYTKAIEALTNGPNSSRQRRRRAIEKINESAMAEIKFPLDHNVLKLLGAMLYWSEGDKTKHFGFANSDPLFVKFMVLWITEIFNVPPENLGAHLNIYAQQNDIEIKKFWSDITGIPIKNFGKTFVKPVSSGYKKNMLYYGTIRVRMPKGTDSMHRVFGWIKALLNYFNISPNSFETKWNALKTDYPRP